MPLSTKKATAQTVASNNIIAYGIFRFHEGMSICRFHELSHTHASLMMENGMSEDSISRRLGHTDSKITKEIYLHATKKLKEKENNQIKSIKIL